MTEYLAFGLLGLGAGALYAALALGLVLTYQSSGVVNFGHGALAMYSTYTYVLLANHGDLLNPFPGPARIHLGDLPAPVCFAITMVVATVLALLLFVLVFRPIRNGSALTKVVASVGVMVTLQSIVTLRTPGGDQVLPSILPSEAVSVLGIRIAQDRLWILALVLALTAVLVVVFRATRFGLATRAVAQCEKGALVLGYSPSTIGAANWVLGSCVAAAVGILVVSMTGLNATRFSLFIVPALGAALVARFESLVVAVGTGLALGAAEAVLQRLLLDVPPLATAGLAQGLPFLLIIGVMAFRGAGLPQRGEEHQRTLPHAHPPRASGRYVAISAVLVVVSGAVLDGSDRVALITSLIGILLCLSLVVPTGFLGQTSLAQMTFAGVGGFGVAKLTSDLGVPFPIAPLLAAAAAMLVGLVLGLPALRVRGVNLAILTIGASVAVQSMVFQNADLTGGANGSRVARPTIAGINLGISGDVAFEYPRYAFVLTVGAFLLAVTVLVLNLRRSATGRQMLAVRGGERAAEASGIDVRSIKLFGFALSAFIAGLAGALMGYQQGQISFSSFSPFASLAVLATAYLGGIANVSGAVIGGLAFANGVFVLILDRIVELGPSGHSLLAGLLVVWYAVVHPSGLAGDLLRVAERVRARRGPSTTGAS